MEKGEFIKMREPNRTDFGYDTELYIWRNYQGLGEYIEAMRIYYEYLVKCHKHRISGQMTNKEHSDSEVIKTNTFTIREEHLRDGRSRQCRINDGFKTFELVGVLTYVRKDIFKQLADKSQKPDIVSKTVIKE